MNSNDNINNINSIDNNDNINNIDKKQMQCIDQNPKTKSALLLYLLFTVLSFFYFITPFCSSVSVPIYTFCQFLWFIYFFKCKKPLLLFIPLFILSLNSAISANTMWRAPNIFISLILYNVMLLMLMGNFPIKTDSLAFLSRLFTGIFAPLRYFFLPLKWIFKERENRENGKSGGNEENQGNRGKNTILRILGALIITIPVLFFLSIMLAHADEIFAQLAFRLFGRLFDLNLVFLIKFLLSVFVGLYFFGLLFRAYVPTVNGANIKSATKNGDLLILNIFLFSILAVYTVFVVIQFRYLFSGATLPNGLNYSEYARRGFFELLFLSGVNVLIILTAVWLTKNQKAPAAKFFCLYLCGVTMVLLASSYYRMSLYNTVYGLTRLRFLVCGFLFFEALGLIFTFFYILSPKFNIVALYLTIGLTYYLVLNLVPMDYFIAKNNVDLYFEGEYVDFNYFYNLSADAAPQIARIWETNSRAPLYPYRDFWLRRNENPTSWQSKNLSIEIAKRYLQ